MHIYIVATYRNGKDESKITDYLLLDIDDNFKTLKVSKEQLVNVLSQNKIKLFNAKLSTTAIVGTYYSLNRLPSFRYNVLDTNFRVVILNKNDKNTEFLGCFVDQNGVKASKINLNTVNSCFSQGLVCNIGDNYLPLCEKIDTPKEKQPQVRVNADVNDVDSEWTIDMFIAYMRSKGYTYQLFQLSSRNEYELRDIDPRCEIAHIPVGVKTINRLYASKPKKIKGIILPKTLELLVSLYKDVKLVPDLDDLSEMDTSEFIEVDYVYFQSKNEDLKQHKEIGEYHALQQLIINKYANCPNRYNVRYLYEYCIFNCNINIDLEISLRHAFCNCIFNNSKTNINVMTLTDSFNLVQGLEEIVIGSNMTDIWRSFKRAYFSKIDFSKAVHLNTITSSFTSNIKPVDIDLSNCKSLLSVNSKSFFLMFINKLILSDSITSIASQCFNSINSIYSDCDSKFKLKEVVLPASLKQLSWPVFDDETIIKFNKQTTIIRSSLLKGYTKHRIEFTDNTKIIDQQAYRNMSGVCTFNELHIPESIVEIQESAFNHALLTDFDSRKLPLVHEIPNECFMESLVETVVLGDNIENIGAKAFKRCSHLRTIVISDKVKSINNSAFSDIHANKITTIYVVKGSYAARKLANTKASLIEMDSFDEIIESISDVQTTPSEKIAKFRLMLAGSPYETLFDIPDYARNINFIYKFVQYINNNVQDKTIAVDTSKYRPIDLSYIHGLAEDYKRVTDLAISHSNTLKRNNVFACLNNLITKLCDNDERLYTPTFFHVLQIGNICSKSIIYCDDTRVIYHITAKILTKAYFEILVIVVNGKIQFMHGINTIKILRYLACNDKLSLVASSLGVERTNPFEVSFTKFLKIGDSLILSTDATRYSVFASDYTINGVKIPNKINNNTNECVVDTLMSMMKNNWIFIGTTITFDETLSKQTRYNEHRNYPTLFYDLIEQKLIEVVAKFKFSASKIKEIDMYTVVNIIDLIDIDKLDKQYFTELDEAFNDESTNNIIELASLSNETIENIHNDMSNYDITGNKNIMDLADAVYKYNIDDAAKLNVQSANALLHSDFFELSDLTMNNIRKEDKRYKFEFGTQLYNSKSMFLQYRVNQDNYIMGVINNDTLMNKKGILYHSILSMREILQTLWLIGEHRSNGNDTSLNKITNTTINPDNFVFIKTLCDNMIERNGIKYDIALDRFNGDNYIICEQWDSDFYTLFRFKHLIDAYDFLHKIFINNLSTLRQSAKKLVCNEYNMNQNADSISEARSLIINGIPNNYPYISDPCHIMDKLSKQPKY